MGIAIKQAKSRPLLLASLPPSEMTPAGLPLGRTAVTNPLSRLLLSSLLLLLLLLTVLLELLLTRSSTKLLLLLLRNLKVLLSHLLLLLRRPLLLVEVIGLLRRSPAEGLVVVPRIRLLDLSEGTLGSILLLLIGPRIFDGLPRNLVLVVRRLLLAIGLLLLLNMTLGSSALEALAILLLRRVETRVTTLLTLVVLGLLGINLLVVTLRLLTFVGLLAILDRRILGDPLLLGTLTFRRAVVVRTALLRPKLPLPLPLDSLFIDVVTLPTSLKTLDVLGTLVESSVPLGLIPTTDPGTPSLGTWTAVEKLGPFLLPSGIFVGPLLSLRPLVVPLPTTLVISRDKDTLAVPLVLVLLVLRQVLLLLPLRRLRVRSPTSLDDRPLIFDVSGTLLILRLENLLRLLEGLLEVLLSFLVVLTLLELANLLDRLVVVVALVLGVLVRLAILLEFAEILLRPLLRVVLPLLTLLLVDPPRLLKTLWNFPESPLRNALVSPRLCLLLIRTALAIGPVLLHLLDVLPSLSTLRVPLGGTSPGTKCRLHPLPLLLARIFTCRPRLRVPTIQALLPN